MATCSGVHPAAPWTTRTARTCRSRPGSGRTPSTRALANTRTRIPTGAVSGTGTAPSIGLLPTRYRRGPVAVTARAQGRTMTTPTHGTHQRARDAGADLHHQVATIEPSRTGVIARRSRRGRVATGVTAIAVLALAGVGFAVAQQDDPTTTGLQVTDDTESTAILGDSAVPATPLQHVLLVGDSIMRQTGPALERQPGAGYLFHNEAVNGSGLLTPAVFDWPAHLTRSLRRFRPDIVVMTF